MSNFGKGSGQGSGGQSNQAGGRGGSGGPSKCICPGCGYEEPHQRGVPCSENTCPECGTRMVGKR